MPSSSAAARSLALALPGLGAAPAFAQDTVGPAGGPAFNPWQQVGPAPVPGPGAGILVPNT